MKRLAWLVVGVAVMAGAGYLLAALVLFPAPLLPNERAVPRVVGEPVAAAEAALAREGFAVQEMGRERHPTAPEGTVIWQEPPAGVAMPRGDTVALTLSDGPLRVAVPDVFGLDADLAQRLLWGAGLRLERADTVPGTQPPGVALGTTPAAGDSLISGGTVVLHLSKGTR